MPDHVRLALFLIGSYAVGCVVGAYYLVRWRTGRDLRTLGSGNAGARNAGRVLGWAGFALSILADSGKGALVVWLASRLSLSPVATIAAMLAVVAGHLWPVQLHFRGGKGAATALGIMLVFDPLAALILIAIGSVALILTRRFTIGGLVAIALAPAVCAFTGHSAREIAGLSIMSVLILFAHRSNLLAYRTSLGRLAPTEHQELAQ